MASPSLKGLKSIINIPPAKLDSDPCNDKPIASPAAPKIATNEDDSTPSLVTTATNKSIFNPQNKISDKNSIKVGSIPRFIIIFRNILFTIFIDQLPKMYKSIAPISFGE